MSAEAAALPRYSPIPPGLRPLLLLVGVAAAIAAGVFIVLWSRGPSFSLLYANLGSSDQASIAQALDSSGIPYRLEPASNGISVPRPSDRFVPSSSTVPGYNTAASSRRRFGDGGM